MLAAPLLATTTAQSSLKLVMMVLNYIDVDLLVSPYWNTPAEFYNFLRHIPKEKRSMYDIPTIP